MAPTTHLLLRILAILVILLAYLLPHGHTSKSERPHTTESEIAPRR